MRPSLLIPTCLGISVGSAELVGSLLHHLRGFGLLILFVNYPRLIHLLTQESLLAKYFKYLVLLYQQVNHSKILNSQAHASQDQPKILQKG